MQRPVFRLIHRETPADLNEWAVSRRGCQELRERIARHKGRKDPGEITATQGKFQAPNSKPLHVSKPETNESALMAFVWTSCLY
jgi:hypothetical protein